MILTISLLYSVQCVKLWTNAVTCMHLLVCLLSCNSAAVCRATLLRVIVLDALGLDCMEEICLTLSIRQI